MLDTVYDSEPLPDVGYEKDSVFWLRLDSPFYKRDYGRWYPLSLPADEEKLERVAEVLGVSDIEEGRICFYGSRYQGIEEVLPLSYGIRGMNAFAGCLKQEKFLCSKEGMEKLFSALEAERPENMQEVVEIAMRLELYEFLPEKIVTAEDYGEYLLEEAQIVLDEKIAPFIDIEGYGFSQMEKNGIVQTEHGLIFRKDKPIQMLPKEFEGIRLFSPLTALMYGQEEMADKKSELEGILEELEKNLQGTAKENMEYIESRFSSMELLTKASLEELSENINLSAAGLQERLSEIHVQISDTKEQIGAALKTMDQKQEENCQELMHAIEEATKKIDGELEAAYLQLEVLITQLSADTEADHAETLKVLDGMRASLGTSMQQNLDQLNASFSSLNSALEVYFEKLQEAQGAGQDAIGELGIDLKGNQQIILDSISAHGAKVQEGHSGIKESITQHNASMNAGLEGVGNAVGAYQTSMQEFLTQLKTELNDQLKSVFTFVSNGKQGLASALLTKGMSCDATYRRMVSLCN